MSRYGTETQLKEKLIQKISPRVDYKFESDGSYYNDRGSKEDKDYERWRNQESVKRNIKINQKDTKRRKRIMKFSGGSDEFNELFNKLYNYRGKFKTDSGRRWDSDSESYIKDTRYQDMEAELYALAGREGINVPKLLRKYKRTDRVTDRREDKSKRKYNRDNAPSGVYGNFREGYNPDGGYDQWSEEHVRGVDNNFQSSLYEGDERRSRDATSWAMLDEGTKKLIDNYDFKDAKQKNEFINNIFLGNTDNLEKIIGLWDDGKYGENYAVKDKFINSLVSSPHWGEDLNKLDGKESKYHHMDYNEETGELEDDYSKQYDWNRLGGERDYGNKASFRKKHSKISDEDVSRRVVDRKLFDSDRQVYRRKDPSSGEYKYYTQWELSGMGGREREISEKKFWKIKKRMNKRQDRVRGSEFKEVDVND